MDSQNYLEAEWHDERVYQERVQLNRLLEEVQINIWTTILVTEQERDTPNANIISNAALKAILHTANLMTWQTVPFLSNPDATGSFIGKKEHLEAQARELYSKGNSEGLLKLLNELNAAMNMKALEKRHEITKQYYSLLAKERKANGVFLILYISGSALIGIGYVLSRLRTPSP